MADLKTPGVYVTEKNAFPNSIVPVDTAMPAFIGYTEKAAYQGKSLLNVPLQISSAVEFATCFGGAPPTPFNIVEVSSSTAPGQNVISLNGKNYTVSSASKLDRQFLLCAAMRLFFQNGGGTCYIVSVGDYNSAIDAGQLTQGIDLLNNEQEPTMVVVPDAMHLPDAASCATVQLHALNHCGAMKNRIAILDIYNGFTTAAQPDPIAGFRAAIGTQCLDFAAAYYPWIETSILSLTDFSYTSLDATTLTALLTVEAKLAPGVIQEVVKLNKYTEQSLNAALAGGSPFYKSVAQEAVRQLNILPPSAAMAGIYTRVDEARGVWKAPADVSIVNCVAPTVAISDQDQPALNVPLDGKSINALRSFPGQGTLVWGARTLDGNSTQWRYVSVRRTVIMIEQSITLGIQAYVFEPNIGVTWDSIKAMIENFLTGLWRQGCLVGSTPTDAYYVSCGLGESMTAQDIQNGVLRVTVGVALQSPAEFVILSFEQQMPTT